jgi:hypothetical protein
MIAIWQRVERAEWSATWRQGAYLAVALIGFAILAPSAQFFAQQTHAAQFCDSQDSGCAAQPQSVQFTLLADMVNQQSIAHALPTGVGTLKGAAALANKVSGLRSANTTGQPCHSATMWVAHISNWATPPSCYANIFSPNPSNYSANSTFGYCNWWVEALHPNTPDILTNHSYPRSSTPTPGAAVWFDAGVQGASSAGHWAQVVALNPDGYWMLITEMNFAWRGGGFGRVDYRYVHVGPGVVFIR